MNRPSKLLLFVVLALSVCCLAAVTVINLATQVTGVLATANGGTGQNSTATYPGSGVVMTTSTGVVAAQMPALTGDVTTSAGAVATSIASGAVTATKADTCTVDGYGAQGSLTNPAATTDTQLAEFALSSACLNTANKSLEVYAHVVTITGTSQTPTYTVKVKVCTISGCGSGTALTACSFGPSGAMTASTTVHAEMRCNILTTTTGSSGVLESAGFAILNITSASGTGGVLWNDTQTAGSSAISLTGSIFVDVVGQLSAQSGTKNSMQARLVRVKPAA